ncbi:hypothetical protein [Aurantimonas endophytica]|uniref:ArsR family transcriptional regulator n=1 Tax=Aurantimonas endophytica TaxID=1522175 RepID=A0A7W6HGN1_9HYPH|nr:hypothetical protein [Aurantimonas endophytica]MBB4004588.1 hypothetical protein [Aurantimonas endophytica]MCO6405424.1 hypothetical protein [Aurantimonas endophytica]
MSEKSDLRNLGLTPSRIFLMRRLNEGPEEDCVGLEMNEMTGRELQAADYLTGAKLAEVVRGWQMSFWYRLTPRGRQMLRMLSALGL